MLVSKDFYGSIKEMVDRNLDTLDLYDIIFFYVSDGQTDKRRKWVYMDDDKYYSLLTNTLFAIRDFDDELSKKHKHIIIEIIKEI